MGYDVEVNRKGEIKMEIQSGNKTGDIGVWLSIIAYLGLSAVKLFVGYHTNSEALMADGWNNTTDIFASVAVLIGLRISRKPADRNHRYGHFRAETISALVASFIMMTVGLQVIYHAVISATSHTTQAPDIASAWTAAAAGVIMYMVYRYNKRLAAQTNSSALKAAAKDNLSDSWVSAGALVGIIGAQFGLHWLDPVAAGIVGVLICRTAWDIFRDASHALTDGFDYDQLRRLRQTVESTHGVQNVKDIRARILGNNVLVDITIEVSRGLNVVESHDISDRIESRMRDEHQIGHVHIHVEPARK
jgi:cation diffusion facilitator family transporter